MKRFLATVAAISLLTSAGAAAATDLIHDDFESGLNGSVFTLADGVLFGAGADPVSFPTGNALYMNGDSGYRDIVTADFDLSGGGSLSFDIIQGSYDRNYNYFEGADDPGEAVYLRYSTDAGLNWIDMDSFGPGYVTRDYYLANFQEPLNGVNHAIDDWTHFSYSTASASSVRFQLVQFSDSGDCCDHWAVDNVVLTSGAVPEPASWALMIAGFGGVGAVMRRRREMTAVVA